MNRSRRKSLRTLDFGFVVASSVALLTCLFLCSCATRYPATEFIRELDELHGNGVYLDRVPAMDAGTRRDGIAALNPVLMYWKDIRLSPDEAAALRLRTSDDFPVELVILRALEERGLWSFSFYGTFADVESRLESKQPLLAMVQDDPMKLESRRFVVIIGFNRDTEKILVHEGGRQPRVYTYAAFRKLWRPVKNWVMAVCPPEQADWNMRVIEYAALARFYEGRGDWEKAVANYRKAMSIEPDRVELLLAHADAMFYTGHPREAIEGYRGILAKDDMNARAANNLAFVLAATDDTSSEAEHFARRALAIEPMNPVFMDTLGLVLIKSGRPREAVDILLRAVQRSQSLPLADQRDLTQHLIQACVESNQRPLARQILRQRLEKDPEFILRDDVRKLMQ